MQAHVAAMLEYQKRGTAVFDYGNNLRGQVADRRGMTEAFRIPGLRAGVHPAAVLPGSGPFRWAALSGDPADIAATDDAVLETFPHKESLRRWITLAREKVQFQGLPARICWLEYGERAEAGRAVQPPGEDRQGEGAARHRPRPSRLRLGRVAEPRDGRR